MPKKAQKLEKKNQPAKKKEKILGKRTIRGRVVSVKMAKTAVVLVERKMTHPLYQKAFLRSKKYLAHDETEVKLGDLVEIKKIRPISKKKHWQIVQRIGQNLAAVVSEELKEKAALAIAEVMPETEEKKQAKENL